MAVRSVQVWSLVRAMYIPTFTIHTSLLESRSDSLCERLGAYCHRLKMSHMPFAHDPDQATAELQSAFTDIYLEEEKAREQAWEAFLAQHAHDFSGKKSLMSLASLGIDIVMSMVSSGHSDAEYLELLVQAGCPVSMAVPKYTAS